MVLGVEARLPEVVEARKEAEENLPVSSTANKTRIHRNAQLNPSFLLFFLPPKPRLVHLLPRPPPPTLKQVLHPILLLLNPVEVATGEEEEVLLEHLILPTDPPRPTSLLLEAYAPTEVESTSCSGTQGHQLRSVRILISELPCLRSSRREEDRFTKSS